VSWNYRRICLQVEMLFAGVRVMVDFLAFVHCNGLYVEYLLALTYKVEVMQNLTEVKKHLVTLQDLFTLQVNVFIFFRPNTCEVLRFLSS